MLFNKIYVDREDYDKMKSSICLLLIVGLTLALYAQDEKIILYENFDEIPTGDVPEDWTITNVGTVEVDEFPTAANKSLHFVDQGSGAGVRLMFENTNSDVFSVEYKFYIKESGGSDVEIVYVEKLAEGQAVAFNGCCVAMHPGGSVEYHDGAWQDGPDIKDNKWYYFKCIIRQGNSWDFYFDNKKIAEDCAFRAGVNNGFNTLLLLNYLDGGTTLDVYLDELIVYEGTERPIQSVEKRGKLATTWCILKVSPETRPPEHDFEDF